MRILLTTTSYQDTPGPHHELLASSKYEIVRERGPLSKARMLELAGGVDGVLCGDDDFSREVLEKFRPRLKVISKYGIGLDKIDLASCQEFGIPVLFTPGVNHTTVAEHTFALMLALMRNLVEEVNFTKAGKWTRLTGHELWGKRIGIVGVGRIGQEMIRRCDGFGMEIHAYGNFWPVEFAKSYELIRHETLDSLVSAVSIVSLHTMLREDTRLLIDERRLALMQKGAWLINSSRGELVETAAVLAALDSGQLAGYAADVMDEEPPDPDHPLLHHPRAIITPHIGSRTYESVPRQALKATTNLLNFFKGEGEIFFATRD